jgi:hypothetical protein
MDMKDTIEQAKRGRSDLAAMNARGRLRLVAYCKKLDPDPVDIRILIKISRRSERLRTQGLDWHYSNDPKYRDEP